MLCLGPTPEPGRGPELSTLLLLTNALQPSAEVLPGLALLGHQVKILPAEGSALLEAPDSDLVLDPDGHNVEVVNHNLA